jgi:putative transposase
MLTARRQAIGGAGTGVDGASFCKRLTLSLPPNLDLSRFKTTSSRLIRRDFHNHLACVYRKPVLWSRSYGISSCGGAPLSVLKP